MPTDRRPADKAAASVVPDPAKGSSTMSPGSEKRWMNQVGRASGNAAGCPVLEHSEAKWRTFVGLTWRLPCQFWTRTPVSAPRVGGAAGPIVRSEFLEATRRPFTYRLLHGLLIHRKRGAAVELEEAFPTIAEAVRPVARSGVLLVPDEFLRPAPAVLLQGEDEPENIGVPLTSDDTLLDVEDEGAVVPQDAPQMARHRYEPLHIVVRVQSAVLPPPRVPRGAAR